MMKFGRKIFFARGLYNNPGTLLGPAPDLPDSLYEILIISFQVLVFLISGLFSRENVETALKNIFQYRSV